MNEKKSVENLLAIAQRMADDKLMQEKQRVAEKIRCELDDVNKAVEMVRSGLCYSKRSDMNQRYVFATEDMLVADYLSEPKNPYTYKGIRFNDNREHPYSYIFSVNGIYYYDIRYILNAYEEDVRKEKRRITDYNDRLNELIREFDRLIEERKAIKIMLDDWSSRQTKGGEVG